MGKALNSNVKFDFESPEAGKEVQALGINLEDAFLFAAAEIVTPQGCKEIRYAVIAKSEPDFRRLLPAAKKAGHDIPEPPATAGGISGTGPTVTIKSCCTFSRDAKVLAVGDDPASTEQVRSAMFTGQSLIVEESRPDKEEPANKDLATIVKMRISPDRIEKSDCT